MRIVKWVLRVAVGLMFLALIALWALALNALPTYPVAGDVYLRDRETLYYYNGEGWEKMAPITLRNGV